MSSAATGSRARNRARRKAESRYGREEVLESLPQAGPRALRQPCVRKNKTTEATCLFHAGERFKASVARGGGAAAISCVSAVRQPRKWGATQCAGTASRAAIAQRGGKLRRQQVSTNAMVRSWRRRLAAPHPSRPQHPRQPKRQRRHIRHHPATPPESTIERPIVRTRHDADAPMAAPTNSTEPMGGVIRPKPPFKIRMNRGARGHTDGLGDREENGRADDDQRGQVMKGAEAKQITIINKQQQVLS